MRITVVGAGVAGLTSALALAERGCEVEVLERGPSLGAASCSRLAGGMLAPWCERESAEGLVVELGQEALTYWPRVHPDTVRHGSLVLAPAARRARTRPFRASHQSSSSARCRRLGDAGARSGRALHPRPVLRRRGASRPAGRAAVAGATAWTAGVPIRFGIEARRHGSIAGPVVDCRGLAARDRLPDLRGVKGEMLMVRCREVTPAPGPPAASALPALHRAARRSICSWSVRP